MYAFVLERQGWVCNGSLVILLGIPKVWGHFCVVLHACAILMPFVTPIGDTTVRSPWRVGPPYLHMMLT